LLKFGDDIGEFSKSDEPPQLGDSSAAELPKTREGGRSPSGDSSIVLGVLDGLRGVCQP